MPSTDRPRRGRRSGSSGPDRRMGPVADSHVLDQPAVPFGWRALWDGPVVDCDVHVNVPSCDVLLPHLSGLWRQVIAEREWQAPAGQDITYPPNAPTTCRPEWRPTD